jgi:hypothetical protein
MGRSGTSALTRVIGLCGAALPRRIMAANDGNPSGYWEAEDAVALNDAFLSRYESSWYDPSLRVQLEPVVSVQERLRFVEEISAFLRDGFGDSDTIVVKDPRITGLLDYWVAGSRRAGCEPKAVQIFRHPAEVASSLSKRDALPVEHSNALWLKYNLLAERYSRGLKRTFVSFDDLLIDWRRAIAAVRQRIDVALVTSGSVEAEVDAFISPARRHHSDCTSPAGDPCDWIRKVYECLMSGGRGESLDERMLDSAFEEFHAAERLFRISAQSYDAWKPEPNS